MLAAVFAVWRGVQLQGQAPEGEQLPDFRFRNLSQVGAVRRCMGASTWCAEFSSVLVPAARFRCGSKKTPWSCSVAPRRSWGTRNPRRAYCHSPFLFPISLNRTACVRTPHTSAAPGHSIVGLSERPPRPFCSPRVTQVAFLPRASRWQHSAAVASWPALMPAAVAY